MKKMIRRTIWTLILVGLCTASAQAQNRIGIVDYKKVVAGYWKTKEATAVLKDRREDLLKELKGLGDQIKAGEEDYRKLSDEAKDPLISTEEEDKRKKAAEIKLKSVSEMKERAREFDRNASANLNEQAERMSERIDEKVRAVLNARAKSGGYSLVIDISARSWDLSAVRLQVLGPNNVSIDRNSLKYMPPVIAYTNGENDISDAVLEQLNADAPPDALKKDEKKEEKK